MIHPTHIIIHSMAAKIMFESVLYTAKEFLMRLNLSVHGFISQDGKIDKWIATDQKALHAGASEYGGYKYFNNFSIGYEILIDDVYNYTEFIEAIKKPSSFSNDVYIALAKQCASDCIKYNIPVDNILAHSEISGDAVRGKGKGKQDVGEGFDMIRFKSMVQANLLNLNDNA